MNKTDKAYLKQVSSWIKGQQIAIYGNKLRIGFLEQNIINDKRLLSAERAELKHKQKTLEAVKDEAESVRQRNKLK